jgi:RNase P subunit RPR2
MMHTSISSKVPLPKPHAKPSNASAGDESAIHVQNIADHLAAAATAQDIDDSPRQEEEDEAAPVTPRTKAMRAASMIPVRVSPSKTKSSPSPSTTVNTSAATRTTAAEMSAMSEDDKVRRIEELELLVLELRQQQAAEAKATATTIDRLVEKNEALAQQNQELDEILQQANIAMKELAAKVSMCSGYRRICCAGCHPMMTLSVRWRASATIRMPCWI